MGIVKGFWRRSGRRNLREKIVVVVLLALLVLPLYTWMVNVVNALEGHDLIDSFELRSERESVVASVFDIGDTMLVVASSGIADSYDLTIYDNSSSVFVQSGVFSGGSAQISVFLNPPPFRAVRSYVVVFVANAFDYPIPGAFTSDTISSGFVIVASRTELDLVVDYDENAASLTLDANLTSTEGFPVFNETVGFAVQFSKQRRTEGWIQLGSVQTDSSGSAELSLAFGLPNGNYKMRAVHVGNENYGRSVAVENIVVVSNITVEDSGSGSGSGGGQHSQDGLGVLSLYVNCSTPYALLPLTARSTFTVDVPLQGSVWILFFLDHKRASCFLSSAEVEPSGVSPCTYENWFVWDPDVLGSHTIICGVVSGSQAELDAAIKNGSGLLNSVEAEINIQRCPVNAVLCYPNALYGNVFPVTVAVSTPRPYESESSGLHVTSTLARRFQYEGTEYVMDDPVEAVQLTFYVNNTVNSVNSTDAYGIGHFGLSTGFKSALLKATAVASGLLSGVFVEEQLSSSKLTVHDRADASNILFDLSVNGIAENGTLYIGVDNQVDAKATLKSHGVWNLPVSAVCGKLVSVGQTNGSGWVTIPTSSNYLRVVNVSLGSGGGGGGTIPKVPNFVPGDVVEEGFYYSETYIVFANGQLVYVDTRGFARIPAGVTGLTLYYGGWANEGGSIEFFRIDAEIDAATDVLGGVSLSWVPNELGEYVVQVNSSSQFDLFTSLSVGTAITWARTNVFCYFDVVKRPVYLSLSNSSTVTVGSPVDLVVNAVDGAVNDAGSNMLVQCSANGVPFGSAYTNSTGIAVFSWTPSSHIVYNVVTQYGGDAVHNGTSTSLSLDLRMPTNLRLLSKDGKVKLAMKYIPVLADTYVKQIYPNSNYGDATSLLAGTFETDRNYVWLKFSLSGLPANIEILDAKVRLWGTCYAAGSSNSIVVARSSDDSWSEFGLTWNNQPTFSGLTTATIEDEYRWYSWNVTQAVRSDYLGDKIISFVFYESVEDPSAPYDLTSFNSKENDNDPHLMVAYSGELEDGEEVSVDTCTNYEFRVMGFSAGASGESVSVYVDGSLYTTAQVSSNPPTAVFNWMTDEVGVHFINVSYGGNLNYRPDAFNFVAKVSASPVSLDFEVTPTVFEVGDPASLRATALNPRAGQSPLSGVKIQFWMDGYGCGTRVGDEYYVTDSYGVVTAGWTYPDDGSTHTIVAKVLENQPVGNVTLAMRPITLTVGAGTRIWLWVERGSTDTEHTVYARLVTTNDPECALANQTLKLDVNGTSYTLTTNTTGHATQPLSLVAVGNQSTTYQIRAVFEGAGFKTSNLTATDPYGHDYLVCTTLQWDFKSSQNSVTLTVEAPKTDVTVSEPASPDDDVTVTQTPESTTVTIPPAKTPEQMQAEAEQSGWLAVWHEFTWWYPWYRLHIQLSMNGAKMHIGFNPVLPLGEIIEAENMGNIIAPIHQDPTIPIEELKRLVQEMLESSIVDVVAAAATTLAAGNSRFPLIIAVALGGYASFLSYLGYHAMQDLYNAGLRNAGKAFMAGIFVGLASVLLTTILGVAALSGATIITTNAVFAMIGALVGNSYDPKPAMDYIRTLIIASLAAIAVSAVALRIPEPIGNTFLFAFLMITIVAMGVSAVSTGTMG